MPTLALLATGGTIAGSGPQHHYTAGVLNAASLLAAVPELSTLSDWQVEQLFSLDSRDMQPAHWLQLAGRIQALLADPAIDGIIVTHGTDTLEETACALHHLIETSKPLVLTAAMRPASALSADGPLNLLHAACTALDPLAAQHGVVVVADASVVAARHLVKTNTHKTDALQSIDGHGTLGQVLAGKVHWLAPTTRPAKTFQLDAMQMLPRVDILSAYAGASAGLIDMHVADGARGLVLALSGHGSIPADWRPALARARKAGIQIIRASRIPAGGVWPNCNEDDALTDCVAARLRTPQQARVLLMLALASQAEISRESLDLLFAEN